MKKYFLVSRKLTTFADKMTEQEILRQKAPHYLLCFIAECPLHETSLHWLCGQESSGDDLVVTSVNPRNPLTGTAGCPHYREKLKVRYAKGMVHFFDQMPRRTDVSIKSRLIGLYSRKTFYEYRNGVRLIPPQMQDRIARICREEGWPNPPQYDSWQDEFLW